VEVHLVPAAAPSEQDHEPVLEAEANIVPDGTVAAKVTFGASTVPRLLYDSVNIMVELTELVALFIATEILMSGVPSTLTDDEYAVLLFASVSAPSEPLS
jgi:hypothetical protein